MQKPRWIVHKRRQHCHGSAQEIALPQQAPSPMIRLPSERFLLVARVLLAQFFLHHRIGIDRFNSSQARDPVMVHPRSVDDGIVMLIICRHHDWTGVVLKCAKTSRALTFKMKHRWKFRFHSAAGGKGYRAAPTEEQRSPKIGRKVDERIRVLAARKS